MDEVSPHLINNRTNKMYQHSPELNNNSARVDNQDFVLNNRNVNNNNNNLYCHRRISFSSASSCHSDFGEDVEKMCTVDDLLDVRDRDSSGDVDEKPERIFIRQRSLSDVGTHKVTSSDDSEAFPSLPNCVLEKMGLRGYNSGERLSEEDIEQKFVSLSLAFTIDSATIKDRCERQRRQRDQTETNLNVEIERLIHRANRIQHLCIDAETTELLTSLLTQIDIVTKAAILAQTTAERYGAVQHEERLAESVNLMVNHVNMLKQQRDSARRQLQYTKRMLQENSDNIGKPQQKTTVPNDRLMTRRRASIATFNQSQESPKKEGFKPFRRPSDFNFNRASSARNGRPCRLELGLDLVKIREGSIELDQVPQNITTDDESVHTDEDTSRIQESEELERKLSNSTFRGKVQLRLHKLLRRSRHKFKEWTEDGTWHEVCCFCALMCFSLSLIIMSNILLEYELAKYDVNPSNLLWFLSTGNEQELTKVFKERQHYKHPK